MKKVFSRGCFKNWVSNSIKCLSLPGIKKKKKRGEVQKQKKTSRALWYALFQVTTFPHHLVLGPKKEKTKHPNQAKCPAHHVWSALKFTGSNSLPFLKASCFQRQLHPGQYWVLLYPPVRWGRPGTMSDQHPINTHSTERVSIAASL